MEGHVFRQPNWDNMDQDPSQDDCGGTGMTAGSNPSNDNRRVEDEDDSRRVGSAGWLAVFVLGGFLVLAVWYAVVMWGQVPDVGIPATGWLFLILGVVVTVLIGAGLMALVFYSSRHNRDF
jgi:hypothetical protein